ncbi:DUF481 domain-containing protein [candidate division KSB1 bacterium]
MNPKRTIIIVLALHFINFAQDLTAQVNIEKFRHDAQEERYSAEWEFNISSKTGNVDLTKIGFDLQNNLNWDNSKTLIILLGDYGWQGGRQYSNEALIHLRHIFFPDRRIQPESFTQIDYNKKRALEFRSLFGGGVRFQLLNEEKKVLALGGSLMYEHERIGISGLAERETDLVRLSSYFSGNIAFGEIINWACTAYIQPYVRDFSDFRLIIDTDFQIPLTAMIAFDLSFRSRFDNMPPANIKKHDSALNAGIAVSF